MILDFCIASKCKFNLDLSISTERENANMIALSQRMSFRPLLFWHWHKAQCKLRFLGRHPAVGPPCHAKKHPLPIAKVTLACYLIVCTYKVSEKIGLSLFSGGTLIWLFKGIWGLNDLQASLIFYIFPWADVTSNKNVHNSWRYFPVQCFRS